MANNDALNGLKKSLDSFSDVALAEFALTELDNENNPDKSDKEQQEFANSVTEKVKAFLKDNRDERRPVWDRVEAANGKDFFPAPPVGTLTSLLCPPGFHEEGGLCIPNKKGTD